MKLLSFQPFPLYTNGGGSRLLRRLYGNKKNQVISVTCWPSKKLAITGDIPELIIPMLPVEQFWMRWHLRHWIWWLRLNTFLSFNIKRIQNSIHELSYDVIHIVNHGPYSSALLVSGSNHPIWTSFHDHFLTTNSPKEITQQLWQKSDRRLVISKELGLEYCLEFGKKEFEIITDGVYSFELSAPLQEKGKIIKIYFTGLLHIEYLELFRILADAIDALSISTSYQFELIIRGTEPIEFLKNREFRSEHRVNFISDAEIKQELDSATILYLPTRFHDSDFYLYSLPTKMISYLGASGAILYHGPSASVTHRILHEAQAATCCCSLDKQELIEKIQQTIFNIENISTKAKALAKEDFDLEKIISNFWQE